MKKIFLIICLIIVGCLGGQTLVLAAPMPIIPIDEIKPGMTGYGKTVLVGTEIETFDVEVIGVTPHELGAGDAILVKLSGDTIERSGGVARGMSGSPVYLDGRLAGAIAYMQPFTDPSYVYLTSIEEMLQLLQTPRARDSEYLPLGGDLMVSGFTGEAVKYLQERLTPDSITVLAAPIGQTAEVEAKLENVTLEPGSAFCLQMARGDVSASGLGTVTWVDDQGNILGLGHQMLKQGAADYFMTNAWCYGSLANLQSAFKVGVAGKVLGRISQDRAAGVAGEVGKYPKIIPMFVSATDTDRSVNKSASVQLVTAENLVPKLADGIVYNTVTKAMDRLGGGTSRINFRILARGSNEEEIVLERENMFFNNQDVAKITNQELAYAFDMLMNNRFEKVTIFDVNVNVEVGSNYDVVQLLSAKLQKPEVKAGEKALIDLEFQPYRQGKFKKTIAFEVPKQMQSGPLTLIVRGGGAFAWMRTLLQKQQAGDAATDAQQNKKRSFSEFLADFNSADKNNEIVVDILPGNNQQAKLQPRPAELAGGVAGEQLGAMSIKSMLKGSPYKTKYAQNFIIDGDTEVTVKVIH